MHAMRTEDHRELIDSTLARYGLQPDQLEIVESIPDWCRANKFEDNNAHTALCLCSTADGACHILLVAELTDDDFASIKDAMVFNGFDDEVAALETPEDSLRHLLLHEIACHVLSKTDQVSRDRWAFEQMKVIRAEGAD